MDEPFGALDPLTRDALGEDYRRLHDELGLTSVMITHDMLEALLLADRIAVIRNGRIVAEGTPHALMNGEQDDYVRELMATPRRQAERLRALERAMNARNHEPATRRSLRAAAGLSRRPRRGQRHRAAARPRDQPAAGAHRHPPPGAAQCAARRGQRRADHPEPGAAGAVLSAAARASRRCANACSARASPRSASCRRCWR